MTDEELNVFTEEIQTDGKDTYYFHRYEPTDYEVLDELFSVFTPDTEDVLVDYGCGLGRLNFYIEKRYHMRSTGIEYSQTYYERALENLRHYNGKRDRITFVHGKAEDYAVSPEETIFYFFNPFSLEIFRSVIHQILRSWQESPRTISLILYYPEDDYIFYLERHTMFRRFEEIAASDHIRKDRRERFCLYRLEDNAYSSAGLL